MKRYCTHCRHWHLVANIWGPCICCQAEEAIITKITFGKEVLYARQIESKNEETIQEAN